MEGNVLVTFIRDAINAIHERTPAELVIRGRVLLVGAGGVGTWTALALALSADPNGFGMLIVDDDRLELSNLNRLPYRLIDAIKGAPKAELLYRYVKWLRPWLRVEYVVDRVDDEGKALLYASRIDADVVVDATDNPRSIRVLKAAAKELGIDYLGLHYDGSHITIEWVPHEMESSDWVVDEEQAGYRVFPSCAFVPMFVASIAALVVATRPKRKLFLSCDLRDAIV